MLLLGAFLLFASVSLSKRGDRRAFKQSGSALIIGIILIGAGLSPSKCSPSREPELRSKPAAITTPTPTPIPPEIRSEKLSAAIATAQESIKKAMPDYSTFNYHDVHLVSSEWKGEHPHVRLRVSGPPRMGVAVQRYYDDAFVENGLPRPSIELLP